MIKRYVISHINKDEMRVMTFACQGRNTHETEAKARAALEDVLANNSPENLKSTYGDSCLDTLDVSVVECYEGHHDPKGPVISEQLNPGQVCLTGEMKRIMEEIDKRR